ncbi:tyrosine-type recombinase/integrase [Paraburkholderia kirstenboschensis]|uniref:Tyrosine-type recombinase/integrase n=1 Tax=Paraburkholderia kirstenboschensis TaxID=1245436 RepID=A0ABZ0ERD8_9BURK|nr:tyrosine-type recombinase/integrase [Paraburkholderia kirstenboschensis]WOD18653.1 tyrosine-type recombinase/integrase [Paraburkholderia kirstenboschensis]
MAARRRLAARRDWPDNLYKNGNDYYWFRNPSTGETFGLGYDFKVAAAQVRTVNAELERRKGETSLLQRVLGADMTFSAWCKRYEEVYCERGNSPKSEQILRGHLKIIRDAPFANKSVPNIEPKEIGDWLKTNTAAVSASHTSRLRSRLIDMFNEAIAEGLIKPGKNPVVALRNPKSEVSRDRLTLDEFLAIVAEAKKQPETVWAARAFILALITGQRREDVKGMQFNDVKDGFLWVEQRKSQGRTKLKIPVSTGLKALGGLTIEDVIRECRDDVVSKYLIHHVRHKGTAKPGLSPKLGSFSTMFSTYRDAAKVVAAEGKTPPTFHEIRSLAARLYGDEFGAEFAQALLGHQTAQMTALYRDSRGREWNEVKVKPA